MNSEHNAFTIQFDNLLITNVKGNAHKLNSLSGTTRRSQIKQQLPPQNKVYIHIGDNTSAPKGVLSDRHRGREEQLVNRGREEESTPMEGMYR